MIIIAAIAAALLVLSELRTLSFARCTVALSLPSSFVLRVHVSSMLHVRRPDNMRLRARDPPRARALSRGTRPSPLALPTQDTY